jgi:hypothetical protein
VSIGAQGRQGELPAFLGEQESPPVNTSTAIGGDIQSVDPVLDRLVLKVAGQKPLKVLFDERTELYLDGKRLSLRELKPGRHASIQTTLDGPNIFAISIHMLSETPSGECQGQVLSFNSATGELIINAVLSNQPVKLAVNANTIFAREGQPSFSSQNSSQADIVRGALVSVQFDSQGNGQGIAHRIVVHAVPGAEFAFTGTISALDMHSGTIVLSDPRDDKQYQIFFSPDRISASGSLRQGAAVNVTASYDGIRYVASTIQLK